MLLHVGVATTYQISREVEISFASNTSWPDCHVESIYPYHVSRDYDKLCPLEIQMK